MNPHRMLVLGVVGLFPMTDVSPVHAEKLVADFDARVEGNLDVRWSGEFRLDSCWP